MALSPMFDFDHPFFKPLWVRVGLVLFCAAWSLFEFATAAPFWGGLFTGISVVLAWQFWLR